MLLINFPIRHFYSPCETKTTLLHLSPTSSKVRSRMQSAVTLVVNQSLVKDVICTLATIHKLFSHIAILAAHINFLLVMSMAVNTQRTFLLVSTSSLRQKLKSSTDNCLCLPDQEKNKFADRYEFWQSILDLDISILKVIKKQ